MLIFFFLLLMTLLVFPEAAISGSKSGLLLWATVLVPSLFPFSVLTSLVRKFMQGKSLHYVLLGIGMLSGYPIGARIAGDFYTDGVLSRKKALFFVGLTNNPSAMFVLFFVAGNALHLTNQRYLFYVLLFVSSLLGSLTYSLFVKRDSAKELPLLHSENRLQNNKLSDIIDEEISAAALLMLKIGGYIMLFSIFTALLQKAPFLPNSLRLLLCSSLEITTGTVMIGSTALPIHVKKILSLAATSFGGLSAAAQTNSVLRKTGLPLSGYLIMKLLSSMYAALLAMLFL